MVEARERGSSDEDGDYKDENFIEKPAILDKYKAASQVANAALLKVISLCVVGADIHKVCQEGDKFIEEELKKIFNNKKSKKLERGIAFPHQIIMPCAYKVILPSPLAAAALPLNDHMLLGTSSSSSHIASFDFDISSANHQTIGNATGGKVGKVFVLELS